METAEAGFIAMVMERLHALEDKNAILEKQSTDLSSRLSGMESCLYLKDDLWTFNDGMMLEPAFAGNVEPSSFGAEVFGTFADLVSKPIDDLHLDATAFYGRIGFDFGLEEWPHMLIIGEDNKRVTVREYLEGMDGWCWQWKTQEPDTDVTAVVQEGFAGWRHLRNIYETSVEIYVLK